MSFKTTTVSHLAMAAAPAISATIQQFQCVAVDPVRNKTYIFSARYHNELNP